VTGAGRPKAAATLLVVAVIGFAAGLTLLRGSEQSERSLLASCLGGGGEREAEAAERGACALRVHPESFAELSIANRGIAARVAADTPADFAAAARVRARAARGAARVAGTGGRWVPVGKGPLHADDPDYPGTYGEGFAELAGRVSDYAYDARHRRLYSAVASGGVWMSSNLGRSWRSVGNSLPTQTVGSIAYSRAGGGTLIAVTGDNAFGGNTYGGIGVYRSSDGGRSWQRARGVPSGAQGFKAAVDPRHPKVIYAATGAGLFRSADAGRSFRNVKLPTGSCRGNTLRKPNCFFANIVTDVVVQGPDKFGHKGGTVLAAVGWRNGARQNFNGVPESPGNGLYRSTTGRPGSFKRLDVDSNGFAPQNRVGRVEMGAATGARQDHGYVYAIVQDAKLFNSGTVEGLDTPGADLLPVNPAATPTYLNGVYVSDDFGLHWTRMASGEQMLSPTSGSTLAQLAALGFGPGIQSWYNEWIRPDPSVQSAQGVPTRLVFGLEELFANRLSGPQDGPTDFEAIGPYTANGGPCLLVLASDACTQLQRASPKTTTHPDQHAGIFVPDREGGVTLVAGNDGGSYTQHAGRGESFSASRWGKGANRGYHTLLPYGVAGSKDGVVYAGLQDNGEARIEPDGHQVETYGGDGVFTQVNPNDSDIVYEETPEAAIQVSTDGGKTWFDIDPFVDNPSFYAPIAMDPTDPKHLLSGGREVVETTAGPQTTSPGFPPLDTDWQYVFDLGKSRYGIENQVSAIGVRGDAVYAAYCGGCDPVRDKEKFFAGLATNVGGKQAPKPGTERGWHKVKAKGLPQRFISSVTVDPRDSKTVYVTLGASTLRPYAPPGAQGKTGESRRGGHVYRSTNGGRSFEDISGNLRRLPALWSVVRHGQLIVATTVGVFASRGTSGGHYALLGRNLPPAPVFSMQLVPGHPRQLLVASLGRGVYRYTFPK
jgi:hypothetical protein